MNAVVVSREGKLSTTRIDLPEDEFYKKCGFKSAAGFALQTAWGDVHLYARTAGKANSENKYEFPPPVDATLYFGKCLLVNKKDGAVADYSVAQWTALYNKLYGGFEDLGEEDESEDESVESRTRDGYAKDGFVVSDDELEEEEYS